jgi:hypothetical protein
MSNDAITSIVKFPTFKKGDWGFYVSITNRKNVLVIASKQKEDYDFVIRFFVNESLAYAWVRSLTA